MGYNFNIIIIIWMNGIFYFFVGGATDLTKSYSQDSNGSITSTDGEEEEGEHKEGERVQQLMKVYLRMFEEAILHFRTLFFPVQGLLEVSKLVGIWKAYEEASFVVPSPEDTPGMTQWQKILKCVQEIVNTEVEHVKVS